MSSCLEIVGLFAATLFVVSAIFAAVICIQAHGFSKGWDARGGDNE